MLNCCVRIEAASNFVASLLLGHGKAISIHNLDKFQLERGSKTRAETRIPWGVFMSKVAIDVLPHNSSQPHDTDTHEADAVDAAGTFLKT